MFVNLLQRRVTGEFFRGSLVSRNPTKESEVAFDAHLEALKRKHLAVSDAVEEAQRAPGIDDLKVATMKKKKLRLKEEIARLTV